MKQGFLHRIICRLFPLLVVFIVSCNQDPIFYTIFQEVEQKDPRIEGSPSNMVIFTREFDIGSGSGIYINAMYAGSNSLHWYAEPDLISDPDAKPQWDRNRGRVPQPGGTIIQLAVMNNGPNDDTLYALCKSGSTSITRRIKYIGTSDTGWTTISWPNDSNARNYPTIQSIFTSGNRLFICSSSKNMSNEDMSCGLFYLDNSVSPPVVKYIVGGLYLINGAASDGTNHYFSAKDMKNRNNGRLYWIDDSTFPSPALTEISNSNPAGSSNFPFMSIIYLEPPVSGTEDIAAMDRNGRLFTINTTLVPPEFTSTGIRMDNYFTGALGLWRTPIDPPSPVGDPELLLAGHQGETYYTTSTGYSHGYRELAGLQSGSLNGSGSSFHNPSQTIPSSSHERYLSTIGKYPINYMFQAPQEIDPDMTLFASTAVKGLWSYRKRSSGGKQWNAEE